MIRRRYSSKSLNIEYFVFWNNVRSGETRKNGGKKFPTFAGRNFKLLFDFRTKNFDQGFQIWGFIPARVDFSLFMASNYASAEETGNVYLLYFHFWVYELNFSNLLLFSSNVSAVVE